MRATLTAPTWSASVDRLERDAFALEPIALAVEGLVQTVLLEDEVRQEVRPEHATRGNVEGCRWLADLLALAARDLLADRLDHFVASGHSLERFGDHGRKMAQIVRAAARAQLWRRDDDLLARYVGREVPARGPLAGKGCHRGGFGRRQSAFDLGCTGIGLEFGEGQFQLVEQAPAALRACAVFVAAHLLVHQLEMGVASEQVGIDRPNLGNFGLCFEGLGLCLPGILASSRELGTKLQKLVGGIA